MRDTNNKITTQETMRDKNKEASIMGEFLKMRESGSKYSDTNNS
jgi:hypothetical protein